MEAIITAAEKTRDDTLARIERVEQINEERRQDFLQEQQDLRKTWIEEHERQKEKQKREEEAQEKERLREEEAKKNAVGMPDGAGDGYEIAEYVPGQGVFIGTAELKDGEDNSLSVTFNMFAAPTDMKYVNGERTCLSYENTVQALSELREWHGHHGVGKNYSEIRKALFDDSYNGEWFMPTIEIAEALRANREKDSLKGTFCEARDGYAAYYLTSTESNDGKVVYVNICAGTKGWIEKDKSHMSCRPVRLVRAAASAQKCGH